MPGALIQLSLDVTTIPEALEMAHAACDAGVDWLEAGTPLILAEGLHGVRALRREFPDSPLVADLKTMDGAGLEGEMMFSGRCRHGGGHGPGPRREHLGPGGDGQAVRQAGDVRRHALSRQTGPGKGGTGHGRGLHHRPHGIRRAEPGTGNGHRSRTWSRLSTRFPSRYRPWAA